MTKLERKVFLIDLGFNCAMFLGIAIIALINRKYLETLILTVSFFALRNKLPITYQCYTLRWCAFWTLAIFVESGPFTASKNISLFSGVVTALLITFVLYKLGVAKAEYGELKRLSERTIWDMNETELREYLKSKGIINERQDFVCLKLAGWSYGDIARKLGYAETTMWDWSEICRKKLNIKSWKRDKN